MPTRTPSLTIDGREFFPQHVSGREALGELFRFRVDTLGKDDVVDDFLAKPFELFIHDELGAELVVTGVVTGAASFYEGGSQHLSFELGPKAALLDEGVDTRFYAELSSVDIAKSVFQRSGIDPVRFSVSGSPPVRTYTVQSRESDFAFVTRVLREDGFYAFFEHGDETTLVFADDSTNAPMAAKTFLHRLHSGVRTTEPWISEIVARRTMTSNAATLRDRDPNKPKLALKAEAKAGAGDREVYAWPGRFLIPGDGTARAKTMLEAKMALGTIVSGTSSSLELRCGHRFEVEEGVIDDALRELFCIAVEYEFNPRGDTRCAVRWTAVPSKVPYRLPYESSVRATLGPENAVIRGASGQEIDVDDKARVVAQPPWDRVGTKDEKGNTRARIGQVALGRSMAIPRIDWSTLVGHYDGDADRPWVMARLVDGTHTPPDALAANMTRTVWQTSTSPSDGSKSSIRFEDKRDAELVEIKAARDMNTTIGDNEARTVGGRHVLEVGKDRTVTIDADDKLTVKKDQSTTVKGKETVTVDGSRSVTVKGSQDATVGGKRTETVTKDRTVDIGKDASLTVSGTMSASAKKGVTREVLKKMTATAGGAWNTESQGGLIVTTKGDASETVGGAKTQNGKQGIQTLVKGDLNETIAAAHAITAQGSLGESAKGKMTLTVGAAVTATAPTIEIVADTEVTIACGSSTIKITTSEVSVKAAALACAGPLVTSSGAQVKHNP